VTINRIGQCLSSRARPRSGTSPSGQASYTVGRIRDSDTVAPGNDPNPPKDTK